MNERPSAAMISLAAAAFCVMSLACEPLTVTLSPTFSCMRFPFDLTAGGTIQELGAESPAAPHPSGRPMLDRC